ncbi:hypothetical protein CW354_14740 [Marinicaulis flavus]|uniref:Uncharacterized protein n=1 Tax=Hyphococcus luteus TaxID=2058213 RepID=A0A2S7K2L2_9PROT|nr:hypothetical protein CW354_14740 [Marinicaulis flavus]
MRGPARICKTGAPARPFDGPRPAFFGSLTAISSVPAGRGRLIFAAQAMIRTRRYQTLAAFP